MAQLVGASKTVLAAVNKGSFNAIVPSGTELKAIEIEKNVAFFGAGSFNPLIKAFNQSGLKHAEYELHQICADGYSYVYPFNEKGVFNHTRTETR